MHSNTSNLPANKKMGHLQKKRRQIMETPNVILKIFHIIEDQSSAEADEDSEDEVVELLAASCRGIPMQP